MVKQGLPLWVVSGFVILRLFVHAGLMPGSQSFGNQAIRRIDSESNLYSPNLYVDYLKLNITLVDFPGALLPESRWELSYRLFFVPEGEWKKSASDRMKRRKSSEEIVFLDSEADSYPIKTLLAEGTVRPANLADLNHRTFISDRIQFRDKIPDRHRTKFAKLLTTYVVKIYDAKLNLTFSRSRLFDRFPFEEEASGSKVQPCQVVYLNFLISPDGKLHDSQVKREKQVLTWP